MGHDVFGQSEQGGLIGYSFFHRPGAQPAGADSQTFGGKDHILGGDGAVNDPKLPTGCKKLRSGKIAAHQNAQCSTPQGIGVFYIGVGHFLQQFLVLHHHKAPAPGVDAAGAAHASLQDGSDILFCDGLVRKLPHAFAIHNGFDGIIHGESPPFLVSIAQIPAKNQLSHSERKNFPGFPAAVW